MLTERQAMKKTPDITSRHHLDWEIHRQVFQCQENTAPGIQKALWYQAQILWSWALLNFWQAPLAAARIPWHAWHILYSPGPYTLFLQNNCCLSAFYPWGNKLPLDRSARFPVCCLNAITPSLLPQEAMALCMLQKGSALQIWKKRGFWSWAQPQ